MCRGSIQERFAGAAVTANRTKTSHGIDHENVQFCLDVCDRVVASLAEGHPVDVACAGAGIGRTTFYRWLERARLPDAPEALLSFLKSVNEAKRVPKRTLAPAKPCSVICKRAAVARPKKDAANFGASAKKPQSSAVVGLAKDLKPPVDCVNYRYLPAVFRSQLLLCIHSLARDFPLEKKLSELAENERCVFESLVNAVAHSSCELRAPITFSWFGRQETVMFTDFEFTRPIIHRLAARYIRDRQRHAHPASSCPAMEAHVKRDSDSPREELDMMDELYAFDQFSDESNHFSDSDALAIGLDDSPSGCSSTSSFHDDYMFSHVSSSYAKGDTYSRDIAVLVEDYSTDFDEFAEFCGLGSEEFL